MEIALGVIAIVVSIVTYYAGVRHGRRTADESYMQAQQDNLVDEYVDMARRNYSSGVYSLAMLGLEVLGNDPAIRRAIRLMEIRSGTDPWSGKAGLIADINLVSFFRYVREHKVNFAQRSVEDVLAAITNEQTA